jgi:hypothetical protein
MRLEMQKNEARSGFNPSLLLNNGCVMNSADQYIPGGWVFYQAPM